MEQENFLPTFEIPLNWEPVLVRGDRFDWHKEKPPAGRDGDQLFGSKVYKWEFRSKSQPTKLYIGQSQDFEQRLKKYRRAKVDSKTTGGRFQREARKYEDQGGAIDLYFFDLRTPIRINKRTVDKTALGDLGVRLMLESIAIVSAQVAGFEVVNQLGENWYEKKLFELELVRNFVNRKGKQEAMRLFGFDKAGGLPTLK